MIKPRDPDSSFGSCETRPSSVPRFGPSALSGFLRSRFHALEHQNFRLFWWGQLASLIGTWMQSVAQGWLMHRLTDSAFMLGLLAFAQFVPVTVLTLWAGVLADRLDKRRLLMVTQLGFLVQAMALAIVVSLGVVQAWMVLALALLFGIINAFDLPARQAFVVELVGKEDLGNAIALNSTAFNVARVAGPALAGILVAAVGEAPCFWLNASSFLPVIVVLARMQSAPREGARGAEVGAWSSMRQGIDYALRTPAIRNLLILLGVAAGLGFQYMVLLPVYAREILSSGAETYGAMVSAFGLGSLLAAAVLTRKLDRWYLRRNLLVGLGSAAVGLGLFAWSRSLPLSLAMGFAAGFGLILYVASTNILLQTTTDDRFRGRVMGLYTFMFIGTAPIGALASGAIAQRFGAPIATTCSAVVLLGGAVWVSYRLRVLAAREAAQAAVPMPEKVG